VKGAPLHFIVDRGSQKNLISKEDIKQLDFLTAHNTQPCNIRWLNQGRDIYVSQQCHMPYGINPFNDELLCDVVPLEFCDVGSRPWVQGKFSNKTLQILALSASPARRKSLTLGIFIGTAGTKIL
jgi:hypothetical protein